MSPPDCSPLRFAARSSVTPSHADELAVVSTLWRVIGVSVDDEGQFRAPALKRFQSSTACEGGGGDRWAPTGGKAFPLSCSEEETAKAALYTSEQLLGAIGAGAILHIECAAIDEAPRRGLPVDGIADMFSNDDIDKIRDLVSRRPDKNAHVKKECGASWLLGILPQVRAAAGESLAVVASAGSGSWLRRASHADLSSQGREAVRPQGNFTTNRAGFRGAREAIFHRPHVTHWQVRGDSYTEPASLVALSLRNSAMSCASALYPQHAALIGDFFPSFSR